MTAPTQQPARAPTSLRAVISVVETVAFIAATVLTTMDNGSDFRHAFIAAFIGFIAHGVNHNAGGSPV